MAEQALHYKTLHEWGYSFNQSGRIQDLTSHQERMIVLAEMAENYIQEQQRKSSSTSTKTGIEHRESKQRRIAEAKRKHT